MVLWRVVAAVVGRLPTKVVPLMPGRYDIQPGLRGALQRARLMHLPSLSGLILLLVAMMFQKDTQTLANLKSGVANHYLAFVPPHPDGLATGQLWAVMRQVVSSALLTQNITHNGTFKGVASLRQFRLSEGQTHSFFSRCDASRLDKKPLAAPAASQAPSAWHYSRVRQVGWVYGLRCPYPPEGYNVYLGDLHNHTTASGTSSTPRAARQGTFPNEVVQEALGMLDDLKQQAWVDGRTVALLLTLLAPQPGTATPTAITIIFENTRHSSRKEGGPAARWWASHALAAVDLRPNILPSVLLPVFLAVHLFVMWLETNVSLELLLAEPREAAARCLTLATAVHGAILALHAGVIYLHFTTRAEADREVSRYYVSFDMRFNPEDYSKQRSSRLLRRGLLSGDEEAEDEERVARPGLAWDPEYKISVRRITLARILELEGTCRTLLTVEVMLYLAVFALFPQHHSETIHTAMRTLRGGLKRGLPLVVPLLILFTLIFYAIHASQHSVEEGKDFHSFVSAVKHTLNAVMSRGGTHNPWTLAEGLTGVTLLLTGVAVTLLLWRVCLSPDESRARRTQRLPFPPL